MDFPIHNLVSDQGVPIYLEEYPNIFRPMSIMLSVMAGGADDAAVGAPGIHHWGEHIPFRGTVSFPEGAKQIMGRATEFGGRVSAYTSMEQTVYYASAPASHWIEAAEMLVELVARPLMRRDDIEAERTIIGKEIDQSNATIDRRDYYHLSKALWAGHPVGGRVLGTKESLALADRSAMERMRSMSYGRNRIVVVVAGALAPDEVLERMSALLERLPDTAADLRRRPALQAPLPPWRGGECAIEDSEFEASVVSLLFPLPSGDQDPSLHDAFGLLSSLISAGSLASPLYRILRGERQLVYGTNVTRVSYRVGGTCGLAAKTSKDKISEVVEAFWDVLHDPEIRSGERWKYVQNTVRARMDMHLPDPAESTRSMLDDVARRGTVLNFSERYAQYLSIPHSRVLEVLDGMTKEQGRVVVLRGTK